jgi:predicted lipoprotein with Yx(FWY)xxD motif
MQGRNTRSAARRQAGRLTLGALVAAGLFSSVGAVGTAGASAMGVVISTVQNKSLGTIFVSNNRTLYTLSKNDCTATCLKYWPEVILPKGATKATAGHGVSASKLGTAKVAGGLEVTYSGKYLYWFVGDKGPGQVNGNNLKDPWGLWTVVVTQKPKGGGTTTTTTPTGGVAY